MRKIIEIARNDLRVTFSEKGIWINLVLIPVVLVFMIGIATGGNDSGEPETIYIDVIDEDQSTLSAHFLDVLRQLNPAVRLCLPEAGAEDAANGCGDGPQSLETARTRLDEGETAALMTIPPGFSDAVFAGQSVEIGYISAGDPTQIDPLLQSVQAAVTQVSGAAVAGRIAVLAAGPEDEEANELAQTVYDAASARWAEPGATVTYELAGNADGTVSVSGFSQSAPGIGTMYVMFTVLAGAAILLRERKQWTLQRLMTMPVTRMQMIGGKVVSRFTMGMIQFAVTFAAGYFLGANLGDQPVALLLIMIAFTLCVTSLAFLLSGFVEREEQASSLTTFVVLIAAPLGGAWWPLEIVPEFMRTLAYLSPVGWAMTAFNELMVYNGTLVDVLPHAAVLLAAAGLLFVVSIRRFRYE